MKKVVMMTGLFALTGAMILLNGCQCPFKNSCPIKGKTDAKLCGCGAPQGSEACAVSCKK